MKNTLLGKTAALCLTLSLMTTLVACGSANAAGREATNAFGAILEVSSDRIAFDAVNAAWSLSSPDGTASFSWSRDFSESPVCDVMLAFELKPFTDAGLNKTQLRGGAIFYEDRVMLGTKLGGDIFKYGGDATPKASFEQVLRYGGDGLAHYDAASGRYVIEVGNGCGFEWARDTSAGEQDIVFSLDPGIFVSAGLNPEALQGGWTLTRVSRETDEGAVEELRIVKTFDLR